MAEVVLTHRGLAGLNEGSPLVLAAIADAGIGMPDAPKVDAAGFGLTTQLAMPDREPVAPPGLALPWLGASAINATRLFG